MTHRNRRSKVVVGGLCTLVAAVAGAGERASERYRETVDQPPAAVSARQLIPGRTPGRVEARGGYVSVQVNVDEGGMNIADDAANEPSIAVDPTDPNRIVIGWRQFDNIVSNFRQGGWAYSQDGGASWTFPGVLTPGTFRSDPVLDVSSNGTFYYDSLQGNFAVDVFTSLDGGISWGSPVPAFGGDKNWMVVDRSGGLGDGHVYGNWQLIGGCCGDDTLTRSTDGAQSFETPVEISDTPVLGTMAVGPEGELYAAGEGGFSSGIFVARSNDARDPGETPTFVSREVELGGGVVFGGTPNPGGLLGQVWTATDPSTPGRVYLLASVDPSGSDPLDVHFARSDDGGSTWTAPRRVNDDEGSNWQWFGTLSVAPGGRLDVIWNDTRASGDGEISELYYTYSHDGGDRWATNVPVSPSFDSTLGWPNQSKIGDYYDMVSDETGANLAYSATFNGEQDVYYLRLFPDCNGNGISDVTDVVDGTSPDRDGNGLPDECELQLGPPAPGQAGVDNTLTAEAGTPGATVSFLFSTTPGTIDVPGCAGLELGLDSPRLLGEATVGGDGTSRLTFPVPDGASGRSGGFQAVELSNCTASPAVVFRFP